MPENRGRTFWYIAPTYSQGKEVVWSDPKMLFKHLPKELIAKKNESELWVKTTNNTRIVIKGGEEPDSLLGADPYGIVVDETQSQKPELYERVLRPILAANGGWIWFLGTPRLKDHFHKLFIYAGEKEGWQNYHLSAETSGIIPMEELMEIKSQTPQDLYEQEYEAKFLDGEGAVFRNIDLVCKGEMEAPIKGHTYSIGVDLARKSDYTVITVFDQSQQKVVHIDRFNDVDWRFQKAKIEATALRYNSNGFPAKIKIDSTGVGDPIYRDLLANGLLVQPMVFTNKSKEEMVRNLQIYFDHMSFILPNFKPLMNELEVFEEQRLPSGRSRFCAPARMHDDCVFSLALAVWQAPYIPEKADRGSKRSLLMSKYRDQKRYSKKRKGVYNLYDVS